MAEAEPKFNPQKKKGRAPKAPKTLEEVTPEVIAREFDGFTEVEQKKWSTLTPGTEIGYVAKVGKITKNAMLAFVGVMNGKPVFRLRYGFGGTTWNMPFEKIDRLFIRKNEFAVLLENMQEQVRLLTQDVHTLRTAITHIANKVGVPIQ